MGFCVSHLAASFNQPKLCPDASWNPNATTFANSTTVGSNPRALFVNTDNTVFVARSDYGQIVIWQTGNSTPTNINPTNALYPSSLFVTADDQIFVDNGGFPRYRVDRWSSDRVQLPSPMLVCNRCDGLFVNINNDLYCSQDNQHQVLRKSLNNPANMLNTIVAGSGCIGSASNELNYPFGIFVTMASDLYVADSGNNRVQLFRSGESNATTVAGDGASGAILLSGPTGVVLDADGYLFIVERDNHRIIGSGPGGFRCVVGCSGVNGSASDQLYGPLSLSFDRNGNLFVADRANDRIQKFFLTSDPCGE